MLRTALKLVVLPHKQLHSLSLPLAIGGLRAAAPLTSTILRIEASPIHFLYHGDYHIRSDKV
jgi:hypothetical protein